MLISERFPATHLSLLLLHVLCVLPRESAIELVGLVQFCLNLLKVGSGALVGLLLLAKLTGCFFLLKGRQDVIINTCMRRGGRGKTCLLSVKGLPLSMLERNEQTLYYMFFHATYRKIYLHLNFGSHILIVGLCKKVNVAEENEAIRGPCIA